MMTMMAESKAGESGSFAKALSANNVITSDAAITKAAVAWFSPGNRDIKRPQSNAWTSIFMMAAQYAHSARQNRQISQTGFLVGQVGPSRNGRQRYFIER